VLRLLLLTTVAASASGCISYWRGQEMGTEIKALQGQVDQLTEDHRKQGAALRKTIHELEERVAEIKAQQTKAIERLQTGTADYGMELEKIRSKIQALEGALAEAKRAATENADPLGPGVPAVSADPNATPLPQNEAELYRYGWERKKAHDCDEAIRAFAVYVRRFPRAERADNALYLAADCLFIKKDYTGSIRSLRTIIEKYNRGDKVDDALVLMHDCFVAIHRCHDALPFLETLLADYPRSNRIGEARRKQAKTRRTCK